MARIIDTTTDAQKGLEQACSILSQGLPVSIPTETVYGLAADATQSSSVTRVYETKNRPRVNPLICHMANIEMAEKHAVFDPLSRQLAQVFWPGPLTMILQLRPESDIHPMATAGLPTVGVRIPTGFARDLIAAYGKPLVAPSANTSGKVSPTSAAHVDADLGGKIPLILDAGASVVGVESTIVKVDGEDIWLLRPGGLPAEVIEQATKRALRRRANTLPTIDAPGLLPSHYAPRAAVRLNVDAIEPGEALIKFGGASIKGIAQACIVLDLSPRGDLAEAAANLFDYMMKADAVTARGIAFSPIPTHGLGEAIVDRLSRAAAPRG